MKQIVLIIMLLSFKMAKAQRFDLGDPFSDNTEGLKLIGISSTTGVSSYKYIKPISDQLFGRKISDIVIGVKRGIVVTTIYNLVPLKTDIGIPQSIVDLIQSSLPFPLSPINNGYAINIDNTTISISRSNNSLTFGKDRIMYFSSVKRSVLMNN